MSQVPPAWRNVEPFEITVADEVLADLKARLALTRFPAESDGGDWRSGTRPHYMRRVVDHWLHRFDWRDWERRINALPNYMADVDGQAIHLIMEPAARPDAPVLLLTHGWPGSVLEFLDVIGRLAHPERFGGDACDGVTVVVPSMPGYGFSGRPEAPLGARDIARIWHRLMTINLGVPRFLAQGGDWGSFVTSWLAFDHPDAVEAIHLNFAAVSAAPGEGPPLNAQEDAWLKRFMASREDTGAYRAIQGTRPMTLSHALTDSPAGLAAWILEKFHGWTIPGEDRDPPFDLDWLLANVMLYWLPGPGAASWLYVAIADGTGRALPPGGRVQVPTTYLLCPNDLVPPPPRRWLERSHEVVDYRIAGKGGHFLALEQPDLFVSSMRDFVHALPTKDERQSSLLSN